MSVVGIIAEYNPFHKGHAYQIAKAKEITGAEHVIIVMSGNFVQRGTPAILDKYTRAMHAIQNGASLVLELPVCYSTASAELFAQSAISIFNKLGVVDCISFGCESDDLTSLNKIATILADEPQEYKTSLKTYLSQGDTYPIARNKALSNILADNSITSLLETPNNILAVEYMKALIRTNSPIKPVPVKRIDSGYHSTNTDCEFASATAIRKTITQSDFSTLENLVPSNTLQAYTNQKHFLDMEDFSPILASKLIYCEDFEKYQDISKFLANRIYKLRKEYTDCKSFIDSLLTKNETYTHISRAIMHILLEIREEDINHFKENGYIFYANPLAVTPSATSLLKKIKSNSSIPIISRFGDFYKLQSDYTKKMLDINLKADSLYNYIHFTKNNSKLPDDFTINRNTKLN